MGKRGVEFLVTPEILQKELDHCYLMLKKFGFSFRKPDLYTDVKDSDKFIEINSMQDLARCSSISAVYSDELNGIYAAKISERWPPHQSDDDFCAQRHYILLHELVHAIQSQLNTELRMARIYATLSDEQKERLYTLATFCEGSAEYISLLVCAGNHKLKEAGQNRADQLVSALDEWLSTDTLKNLAKIYRQDYDPEDWEKTALKYFRRTPGVIAHVFSYIIGYYSMKTIEGKTDIGNATSMAVIIKNPPHNYEELLYPEKYLRRIGPKLKKSA